MPFKQADERLTRSTSTKEYMPINILVVKKCLCSAAMYVHKTYPIEPIFTGCEPIIVNIRLEKVNENEIVIKGDRSTKSVRCSVCKRKHLLFSFEEVKNGISEP